MALRRGCPSDGGEVGFCGDRGGFLGDGGDPSGFRSDGGGGGGGAGPESVREFTQHARDVLRNLQELRARSALTDVTLRAGGRDFPAHSAVLAACSGFFYSVLAESRGPASCGGGGGTRVLPLPGVDPCGLEVLLDFMYTSRLPLSLDSVLGVMAAARYLQMEHVVRTCEAFLDSPQALPERLRNLDPNIHGSFPATLLCGINPGFPLGGPLAPPPLFLRGPPSPPPQQPQQHHPMGPPPRFTFPDPPPPAAPRRWASAPAPAATDPASPSGGGPAAEGPSEGAGPPGAPSARRVSEPSSPPDNHRKAAPAGGQVKSCNWKKRRFLVQTTSTSSTSSSPPSSPSSSSSPTSDSGAGGGDARPPTPPATVAAAAAAAAAAPSAPPTRLSPTPEAKVMTTLSPVRPRGRDDGAPALFPWDLGPIVASAVTQPPPHPSSSALVSTPASSSPTPPRATCVAAFDVMKLEGGSEARGPAGEWGAPSAAAAISGIHQLTHFTQLVDRLKEESGGFKRPELGLPVAHSADSPPPEGDGHAASPGLAGSPGLAMSPGLTNSPSHDGPHDPTCVRACGACGLGFPEEGALRRHIARIHADDKPYKCDTCHAAFRYKGNLSSHRTVHSGEKPYRCTVCGAQFNRPANLKTHTRIHSGEKPYKCDTCGACFVQVAHLRAHVLIHTGEKPYPCETCGTRFRHLQTLKSHIRIHTGEKPYHCESCDLHFRHKSQLRLHLRQKHGAITNTKVKYQVLDVPEGSAGLTGEGPAGVGATGGGGAPLADDAGDVGRPSPATRGPEAGPVAGALRQSPDEEPPAAPLGFPHKRSSSGGGGGGAASSDDDDSGLSMNGDPESPVAGAGRAPCGLRWV